MLWTKYCFFKKNYHLQRSIAQYRYTIMALSSKSIGATHYGFQKIKELPRPCSRTNSQPILRHMYFKTVYLGVDIVKVDALAWWKISKRHFFKDIANSFHEVTHLSLEPHQFFSFQNISTNTVARDVQSFGQNGLWLAGCTLWNDTSQGVTFSYHFAFVSFSVFGIT